MSQLLIVVESEKDWAPYYPSKQVISFADYLNLQTQKSNRTRVINLCRNLRYLSKGYYCSLLAEARGHSVIPSVRTLNALRNQTSFAITQPALQSSSATQLKKLANRTESKIQFFIFFGETSIPELAPLARELFEQLLCPILKVELEWRKGWLIDDVKPVGIHTLSSGQQTQFADALDRFSSRMWRKEKARQASRYDMAILVNPEEKMPPSNEAALKKFIKIGQKMGIEVDLIGRRDLRKLAEYDILFIRETTAINHHTFQFARRAESDGLVVIDDPQSIIRCTNKVYMADLFAAKNIPTPKTRLLIRDDEQALRGTGSILGYPLVLKIPDGSFSRGVVKVEDEQHLQRAADDLFRQSALLLAQEFFYTDFDWRIGILNGKPLYACQYFMARNHWQIYNHEGGRAASGAFKTLPTFEAPKKVIEVAVKAAGLVGKGLYGVDLKQRGEKVVVIEINDNPSLDAGVEDDYLGDELYRQILQEFIDRVQAKRTGNL